MKNDMHLTENCPRNLKMAQKFKYYASSFYMDQNSQNVLINNSRTAQPTLNFNTIFEFLGKFTITCIFFKMVLLILRQSTKQANIWLGVFSTP